MSKPGNGGDNVAHWPLHLMVYFSQANPSIWGEDLPDSPIIANLPVTSKRAFLAAIKMKSGKHEQYLQVD